MGYSDGCGGEGLLGYGFLQGGKCGGEDFVLMLESIEQRRWEMWCFQSGDAF